MTTRANCLSICEYYDREGNVNILSYTFKDHLGKDLVEPGKISKWHSSGTSIVYVFDLILPKVPFKDGDIIKYSYITNTAIYIFMGGEFIGRRYKNPLENGFYIPSKNIFNLSLGLFIRFICISNSLFYH